MAVSLMRILNLGRAIRLAKALGVRLTTIDLNFYLYRLEFNTFLL